MKSKTLFSVAIISLALVTLFVGSVFAAELDLTLVQKTDLSRTDFGSGTFTTFTMVWAGDVVMSGTKIGDFTAAVTKNTYTTNGWPINYDIMVPTGGAIADFFSVRTNHITTGAGSDQGVIYAASPAFKSLIGLPVRIDGTTLRITY